MGVKLALDGVIDYLPAPTDVAAFKCQTMDGDETERKPSDSYALHTDTGIRL